MNRNQVLAGAALLAAIAVAGVAALRDSKADPDPKDVKQLAAARDAGEAPDYAVYKTAALDGGAVYFGVQRNCTTVDAGMRGAATRDDCAEKVTFIDASPCRRRPAKATPGSCALLLPDGGERDFGDLNTLQAGQWVDRGGCEETPCAVFFGDDP